MLGIELMPVKHDGAEIRDLERLRVGECEEKRPGLKVTHKEKQLNCYRHLCLMYATRQSHMDGNREEMRSCECRTEQNFS